MTNTSSNGPFVSMCCKPNELYPPESMCYRNGYLTDDNIILPEIYDTIMAYVTKFRHFSISSMRPSDFVRLYEFSCNGSTYDLEPYPPKNESYLLMDAGWIYLIRSIDSGGGHWLNPYNYCFGSKITENGTRTVVTVCKSRISIRIVQKPLRNVITLIGLCISLPFLVATFLVYSILPELRNLPGSIFRCFLVSVIAFFAGSVVDFGMVHSDCNYYLVVFGHFTVMATFFWMQVMCFNIWWTFRQFRSVQHSSNEANRKKFIIYSIYAWGCSVLIPAVAVIIDSLPIVPKGVISPEIGRTGNCGFTKKTKAAVAIYVYTPMAVTIISNACFIVLTAMTIRRHEKDTTRHFNEGDNQRHNDQKQSFHLYLKLFIVTGILWILDFYVWLMNNRLSDHVACIFDLPVSLQGFFFFLIFVWKANVKRMLLKRLGCKDRTETRT